ncbi:MAG: hypothetical protein NTZ46_00780 [Verrucomicrobia bacterium]|nr:hypothetical protein [Verrucomicrobiota bacterium]
MKKNSRYLRLLLIVGVSCISSVFAAESGGTRVLQNNDCKVSIVNGTDLQIALNDGAKRIFKPEFTVIWSKSDPRYYRYSSHPSYLVAPRLAVRWRKNIESLESINTWLNSPEFKSAAGVSGSVRADGKEGRILEFTRGKGQSTLLIKGDRALDTTRPFHVGSNVNLRPVRSSVEGNCVRWEYEPQPEFTFAASLKLPSGQGDPEWTFTLTPKIGAFFSVAYTGAPDAALADTLPVPQECDARAHQLFNFVMCEADLRLPRVQVSTVSDNFALVADPRECRFRLPTSEDSRFGLMLQAENQRLKPVLLAPLLGGAESRMSAGKGWQFTFRCVVRPGDWKDTYVHIARDIMGFRDQRDNSGAGSLNGTLDRVMDFLADRRGGNHAMWDEQQKYFDYFQDKTGIFKPFSPLYGLSAAIVTDDEEFFLKRARPAVEFALSRNNNVFAPYDNADNKQANSATRAVGKPYLNYAQLVTLNELFQARLPGLRALAEAKGPTKGKISDSLARWRLTGDPEALAEARRTGLKEGSAGGIFSEEELFDLLDLADATRDPQAIRAAAEVAYHNAAKLNLYPVPPDLTVTVDKGGHAPIHGHSFGRHRNWGYPAPQPLPVAMQTVPAWRIARLGIPAIAYPMEYWMNTQGALMRIAGLAQDDFLRDVTRWGMVGRFGNYPGDNRSQDSLVAELPDAVERRPWDWNFASVNPGHAWDFVAQVLDFLVNDTFQRSRGAVDFPALSAAGGGFRVRIHGGKPGRFYGDENVRLWLPRGLVASDNRQLDWLAGYGNGNLYLALCNQSFREEKATIVLEPALVKCDAARTARVWRDNIPGETLRVADNRLAVMVPPKGIVAFAIPAEVKPRLQGKLYDATSPVLSSGSFTNVTAPFGPVHAMLLRAGRGLTSAFVYTEALPENVIAARLRWRQGDGVWQELTDEIYPYEFSPELRDDGGNFTWVLEVENAQQQILRSPVCVLALNDSVSPAASEPPAKPFRSLAAQPVSAAAKTTAVLSDDFIAYLKRAANGNDFGRRTDGRYYPYSTPQGRRIGWRQAVWDKALHASGCTPEEAERHLRADLNRIWAELEVKLAARKPAVKFAQLDRRQQETLLDLASSEGVDGMRPELLSFVLARDWKHMVDAHLYVRYAGCAPDHPRNKAFAQRWNIE